MNFNVTTVFTPLQRQELKNAYHRKKRLDAQMNKVSQQAARSYKSTVEVKRVCRRIQYQVEEQLRQQDQEEQKQAAAADDDETAVGADHQQQLAAGAVNEAADFAPPLPST
jgi:hypothetical protein